MSAIFPIEIDDQQWKSLQEARRHSQDLFQVEDSRRRENGRGTSSLINCLANISEDEEFFMTPEIYRRFNMTFNEFFDELSEAVVASQENLNADQRHLLKRYSDCILPLRDWWVAQGWKMSRRAYDDREAGSPLVMFVHHCLKNMEVEGARPRSLKSVAEMLRIAEHG